MPKRFCQCLSCPACSPPGRKPGSHGKLFDLDSTGSLKCPGCQQHATQQRNARTSTASRGYGAQHRQVRDQLLAAFQPGQLCVIGGEPLWTKENLDLAHNEDRSGWKGLACARHNRNTGNTGRNADRRAG